MTDEFDWSAREDQGAIIQQQVERVAIYVNPQGDLVIRQERRWDEDGDVFILIARGNVEAAVAEMQAAVGAAKPASMTPAERQRKRRASRNVTADVTKCHADLVTDRDTHAANGALDV